MAPMDLAARGQHSLYQFLKTDSGDKDAVGDYRSSPVSFRIAPPEGARYAIRRINIRAASTGNWSDTKYATAELSTGIIVRAGSAGSVLQNYTNGSPIMTWCSWGDLAGVDVSKPTSPGIGGTGIVRWTLEKAGTALMLVGSRGDYLEVVLNDDFRGLSAHSYMAQGQILSSGS